MPVPEAVRPAVFHILLSLSRESMHGLGIAKAVDEATGGSFSLGPGTLYRSLKEMAHAGLIAEADAPSPGADPRRRFYAITDRGRETVRSEAAQMARIVQVARDNQVLPESS